MKKTTTTDSEAKVLTGPFTGDRFKKPTSEGRIVIIDPEDVCVSVERHTFEHLMKNNNLLQVLMSMGLGETEMFKEAREKILSEKMNSEEE